jgi:hypothetical protein
MDTDFPNPSGVTTRREIKNDFGNAELTDSRGYRADPGAVKASKAVSFGELYS